MWLLAVHVVSVAIDDTCHIYDTLIRCDAFVMCIVIQVSLPVICAVYYASVSELIVLSISFQQPCYLCHITLARLARWMSAVRRPTTVFTRATTVVVRVSSSDYICQHRILMTTMTCWLLKWTRVPVLIQTPSPCTTSCRGRVRPDVMWAFPSHPSHCFLLPSRGRVRSDVMLAFPSHPSHCFLHSSRGRVRSDVMLAFPSHPSHCFLHPSSGRVRSDVMWAFPLILHIVFSIHPGGGWGLMLYWRFPLILHIVFSIHPGGGWGLMLCWRFPLILHIVFSIHPGEGEVWCYVGVSSHPSHCFLHPSRGWWGLMLCGRFLSSFILSSPSINGEGEVWCIVGVSSHPSHCFLHPSRRRVRSDVMWAFPLILHIVFSIHPGGGWGLMLCGRFPLILHIVFSIHPGGRVRSDVMWAFPSHPSHCFFPSMLSGCYN